MTAAPHPTPSGDRDINPLKPGYSIHTSGCPVWRWQNDQKRVARPQCQCKAERTSGDGELRERICQAMWSLDSYAFDPDGLTSDEKRTVDAVLQLIAQECAAKERAARVDEIRYWFGNPVSLSNRPINDVTVADRIAQLQAQGGQS